MLYTVLISSLFFSGFLSIILAINIISLAIFYINFQLVSSSVRQVILDAKVGPPSYEKGLAKDILAVVSFCLLSVFLFLIIYACVLFFR